MAEILETTESKRGVYVKNTSTEENQYTLAKYNAEEHMIYLDEAVNTDNDTAENVKDYVIMLNGEEKKFEEFYDSFLLRDDKSMSFNDFARKSGAIVGTHAEVSQVIHAMQNADTFRDELREKAGNPYTPFFIALADSMSETVNRGSSAADTLSQRVEEKSEEQEKLLRRSGYYDFMSKHASALNTIADSIDTEKIKGKVSYDELGKEDQEKISFAHKWAELQTAFIDEDVSQFASDMMHVIRHIVGGNHSINDIAQKTEEMATKIRKEEEQRELSELKKAEESQAETRDETKTDAENKAIQDSSPSWISRLPQPLQNVANWFKDLVENIANNFRKNEELNSDKSNNPPEPVAMADKGKISDAGRKAEGSQSVSPDSQNQDDTASFNKVDFNYTPPEDYIPTHNVRNGGGKGRNLG